MTVNPKTFFDARQETLVVVDLQVRMYAALHEDSGSTQRERLLDFFVNDMVGENVSFGVALHTVKRAEGAEFFADIRVIDIPIDDVTDDVFRMQALPDPIGTGCDIKKVRFFKHPH